MKIHLLALKVKANTLTFGIKPFMSLVVDCSSDIFKIGVENCEGTNSNLY